MTDLDLVQHTQRKPMSMDSLSFRTPALADSSWRSRPKDFNPIRPVFISRRTSPETGLCSSKRKRRSAREQGNAEAGSRICRRPRIKADVAAFYSVIPSEAQSRNLSLVPLLRKIRDISTPLDITEVNKNGVA